MDPITIVGLASGIAQLVDFGGKVLSKSLELYGSGKGALDENIDIETTCSDLVKLNTQLDQFSQDPGLGALCKASSDVANSLLKVLAKVKVNGRKQRWESFQKAVKSIWKKEEIQGLEKRLSMLRDETNLRITINTR
jgi:hypothetical protein